MTREQKLEELRRRHAAAQAGGGTERRAREHAEGKLSADERLRLLFDEGVSRNWTNWSSTVATTSAWRSSASGDGVVTGYGRINGRLTYVFAQDFTVFGGSLSEANAARSAK